MTENISNEISRDRLVALRKNLDRLDPEELQELASILENLERADHQQKCRASFLSFCDSVWSIPGGMIIGQHHKIIAEAFERIASGELKRVIIAMPPRHGKSQLGSIFLPAWFLGLYPHKKVIQSSHTAELAVGFGRQVRNLIQTSEYQSIFPGVSLSADSKAAGRWSVAGGGEYFAIGVGGAVAGKGADLLIIDDPHTDQQGASGDPKIFDPVYEWYTTGPRQRLQPGGAIVVIATRWSKRDLTGRLIKAAADRDGVDEWEVIEFPAILPSGKALWPEFWKLSELEALRAELPAAKWNAQYMQQPTADEGAIMKREWWRIWPEPEPPSIEYKIQTWDTAHSSNDRANYSACTTWGVFYRYDKKLGTKVPQIYLLDALKERLEFPELKAAAMERYKRWRPDAFIIEAKSAGAPLISELRRMGIPVQDFTPVRGTRYAANDKVARANSVSDIFSSGMVWAPQTRWAEEVIEDCASFPLGDSDDLVDSTVMALMRFRNGGFLSLPSDEEEDDAPPRRRRVYY